ncbi:MAG: hypothetical protein GF329_04840 [Candidatus Lokiarchaeota archaeon]|nr:hypothetical protein [Candidatus Lokiarchaeota archaeon]
MMHKKSIYLIIYIILLTVVGLLPLFLPISIMDYSHEQDWRGENFLESIIGDQKYYNDTYGNNLSQPTDLLVYDLRNRSYETQIVLTSLQGLVNRDNVSIFLIYRDSDLFWLTQLKEIHGINYTFYTNSFWNLFTIYNSSFDGLIIYDHEFLHTINVATFLAGVNGSLVIHQDMIYNFSLLGVNEIVYDFRDTFDSKVNLYSWAWNKYNQFATRKMVASLDPEQSHFRDYIIANNMFTFYLCGGPLGPEPEINLFKSILSEYPENIPVFGWFTDPAGALGEYESVKIISKSGKYSLCAAIPDLTVFGSVEVAEFQQKPTDFNISDYEIENKVYVSVVVSDGDNVNFCADRLLEYWQDPERGSVPLGITLEPGMFEFFPTNIKYYYQNATDNEYFLAGPSGAGYCYTDLNPAFPQYLNQSLYAMNKADMDQVWILNGYEAFQLQYSKEVISAYASDNCNFSGIYLNYHDFPAELNYVSNNVPVFQSVFVERSNEIVGKLHALRTAQSNGPIFVFVGFWAWDFSFSKLKDAVDQLGEDYVFLRPDHFSDIYMKYQTSLGDRKTNESIIFTLLGILPLVIIAACFPIFFFIYNKKNQNTKQFDNFNKDDEQNEKIDNLKMDKPNFIKNSFIKSVFFIVDAQIFLIARVCFYSTILNLVYFLFFLISITIGIYLKKFLEKIIGCKYNVISSLVISSVGLLLFYFNPALIVFSGFSLGILLNYQIQSSSSFFQGSISSKRNLIYLLILSSVLILLFPPETYNSLHIIIIVTSFIINGIGIYYIWNEKDQRERIDLLDNIKHWYPKGVLMGFLLFLLFIPTFSPENLFFHLFWGIKFFPTRLTLSFNIACIFLTAFFVIEILRVKNIQLSKLHSLLLFLTSIMAYILIPMFLNGIIFFMISNFVFIFTTLNLITHLFDDLKYVSLELPKKSIIYEKKGLSGFLSQFLFWLLIGLFIISIPPSIIIVDGQEIFASFGITAISNINWPSLWWTFFYNPTTSIFIIIPITLYVLIYGFVSFLINL